MKQKLNDYLMGLRDRYPDAEGLDMSDKIVRGWRSTLEDLVCIIGTTDIDVQEIISDCIYYQTMQKHGREPLRRPITGLNRMPFGQTFETDKMSPGAQRIVALSEQG